MIFGEDLTLARVSIDPSGVVRGVATQKAALAGGEADIRSFGRTAEAATGLAVGGFVLAAAAVGTATYTIAKHSDAWKGFDEAAKKANHSILNLIGDLSGINSGLESATGWLARFGKIADNLKGESLAAGEGGGGYITAALTGTLGWYGLFQKLEAVGKWMDKRLGTNQAGVYGPPSHANTIEGMDLPPSTWPGPASSPLGPAAPPFAQLVGAVPAVRVGEAGNLKDFTWEEELDRKVKALTGDTFDLSVAWNAASDSIKNFRLNADPVPQQLTEIQDTFAQVADGLSTTNFVIDSMSLAFADMGQALTDAFTGAGTSLKAALGDMLKQIATMAFTYALWNAALGAMASTPWGAAFLGPAGPYFKAALAFGVVGAVAATSARAFGGSGGSGDRGSSGLGSNFALAQPANPGAPSVTINVVNSYLGTSEEKVAREFVRLWRKGTRDGA